MITLDGFIWQSLKAACNDLGLDYNDVLDWQNKHQLMPDKVLSHYIRYHRIISRGLIFDNLTAAAKSWGLDLERIKPYLAEGYGFDLSCYMALHGYDKNLFKNKKLKRK